eukprot:2458993-Amphidinium_carterae.1
MLLVKLYGAHLASIMREPITYSTSAPCKDGRIGNVDEVSSASHVPVGDHSHQNALYAELHGLPVTELSLCFDHALHHCDSLPFQRQLDVDDSFRMHVNYSELRALTAERLCVDARACWKLLSGGYVSSGVVGG